MDKKLTRPEIFFFKKIQNNAEIRKKSSNFVDIK